MIDNIRIIKSKRKTISLQIKPDAEIVVRAPIYMNNRDIYKFIEEKQSWIEKHIIKVNQAKCAKEVAQPFTPDEIKQLADDALAVIVPRVYQIAEQIGVEVGKITIRNQVSRWGSCSGKGNLNFNCLLMLCPEDVRDYVIVHELCHRRQMNHSDAFWGEVEKYCPEYKKHRSWLKQNGGALIDRMRKTRQV